MNKYIKNGVVDVHSINSWSKLHEYLTKLEAAVSTVSTTLDNLGIKFIGWGAIDQCTDAGVYIVRMSGNMGPASVNGYSLLTVIIRKLKNTSQGIHVSQTLVDAGHIKIRTGVRGLDGVDWEDWSEVYVEKDNEDE